MLLSSNRFSISVICTVSGMFGGSGIESHLHRMHSDYRQDPASNRYLEMRPFTCPQELEPTHSRAEGPIRERLTN
jgi:hypothetical protein